MTPTIATNAWLRDLGRVSKSNRSWDGLLKRLWYFTVVLLVTLGAAVTAEPLSGELELESTIKLAPSPLIFGALTGDISLELAIDYTLHGWELGSESTFKLDGFDEQEFTVSGRVGGYALDSSIAFDPLITESVVYILARGVSYQTQSVTGANSAGASMTWTNSIWNCATYDKNVTYGSAAFSSLQASAQVSLYGVNFEGLFYLKGNDFEAETVSGKWVYGNPYTDWANVVTQTGSYTASACLPRYGIGGKFTLTGAVGDMHVTSRTYFNLEEYSFNELMTEAKKKTYLEDTFILGGSYYLPEKDGETCATRFTREFLTFKGMTLGCVQLNAGLNITCEGFDWFKVLITDIDLSSYLSFDALITFSVGQASSSKTIALEPNIRFGDMACFTVHLDWDYTATTSKSSIAALNVNGLSMSYTWNGLTFFSATSFNPVYESSGGYYLGAPVTSPTTYGFFVPDKNFAKTDFCIDATTCGIGWGKGYYVQVCYPEEYYDIWELIGLQATGDGCCGEDYSWEVVLYFGDRKTLIVDSFWFWYKDEYGNSYQYNAGTPATRTEPFVSGSAKPYCEDNDVTYGVAYYDAPGNSLFGWVKAEVDAVIPIFSRVDITPGIAVTVYGWEELKVGFSFSW